MLRDELIFSEFRITAKVKSDSHNRFPPNRYNVASVEMAGQSQFRGVYERRRACVIGVAGF